MVLAGKAKEAITIKNGTRIAGRSASRIGSPSGRTTLTISRGKSAIRLNRTKMSLKSWLRRATESKAPTFPMLSAKKRKKTRTLKKKQGIHEDGSLEGVGLIAAKVAAFNSALLAEEKVTSADVVKSDDNDE